jgi:hypothetical protein
MKIIFTGIFSILSIINAAGQPGKYAGTKKDLINTVFKDSRVIPGLSGWTFMEGSLLSSVNDPETIAVTVFKKKETFIVFFSTNEDSLLQESKIVDVLEIKGVTKGLTIKTSFCRRDSIENGWIVALAKEASTEFLNIIKKAWWFNRDKRKIESIDIKGIDCLNEGFDQD